METEAPLRYRRVETRFPAKSLAPQNHENPSSIRDCSDSVFDRGAAAATDLTPSGPQNDQLTTSSSTFTCMGYCRCDVKPGLGKGLIRCVCVFMALNCRIGDAIARSKRPRRRSRGGQTKHASKACATTNYRCKSRVAPLSELTGGNTLSFATNAREPISWLERRM